MSPQSRNTERKHMTDLKLLQIYINSNNAETISRAKEEGWTGYTTLCEAEFYAEHYGITTVDGLREMLDMSTFSDWFKDMHGCRPRGYTIKEARAWMERMKAWNREEKAREEADKRRLECVLEEVKPENAPKNTPFATLLIY